jgi:outer membrane protein OmpA-like peptidoglycan-associated protein/tetratricopeptide (TPR) repeat protein
MIWVGRIKLLYLLILSFQLIAYTLFAQNCGTKLSKKQLKLYTSALEFQEQKYYGAAKEKMYELIKQAPDYAPAQMMMGIFFLENPNPNIKSAQKYLDKSIKLCPDSTNYSKLYLGKIYYGSNNFGKAIEYFENFLDNPDKINNDEDFIEAENYLEYTRVSHEIISNPVPFTPIKVEGVSTKDDEYLPIISPDNDYALFTRRKKEFQKRGLTERVVEKEIFTFTMRNKEGVFERGWELQHPFNQVENEGAATLTIDNNHLYYTVCTRNPKTNYLNCDLYQSHYIGGYWTDIQSLGEDVNQPDTWESQPSITSDGNTIYFASNRKGGLGGYDLYKTDKKSDGSWSIPENLGPTINTTGNEKSPFIHTDSQTLYFSSDGHKGIGGYDIFYSRKVLINEWTKPQNIGYPINSFEDDIGFFVSTDGHLGYYASNRFDENNKWNLYSFSLYEEARPQKVLFIKGVVELERKETLVRANIELKNIETKAITEIPVDTLTGKYVAAILFNEDHVMTIKKEGFVSTSRYFSTEDTTLNKPKTVDLEVKEIKIGSEYEIKDIHFATDSYELDAEAEKIVDEFFTFLHDHYTIEVQIQGHTDNVGDEKSNLILSQNRAESVYNYLIEKGIQPDRLSYKGFGERKPVATNATQTGRLKNRRTVFLIIDR